MADFTDKKYTQSMIAFQLPESTIVNTAETTIQVKLNSKIEWASLGCSYKLTVANEKTIMILYKINLFVDNADISTRLRIEKRYNV